MTRSMLRRMRPDDHAQLVDLHCSAFGDRHNSVEQIRQFYRDLLTRSADADTGELSGSLVGVDGDGSERLVAMVIAAPLELSLDDASINGYVGTLLAKRSGHPDSSIVFRLLRELFADDHDFVLADRVNRDGRRVAERVEMVFFPQYSLRWVQVISPGRAGAAGALNRDPEMGGLRRSALSGLGKVADAATGRFVDRLQGAATPTARGLTTCGLTAEDLVVAGEHILEGFRLRPSFASVDHIAAQWRWLDTLRSEGSIERVAIRSASGELVAWYLLHVWPSGTAEVVQLATRPSQAEHVIRLLFDHAALLGVGSLHGNAHPSLHIALAEAGALFHGRGSAFGVSTRNEQVLEAFSHGAAWLSGLEGEYPLQLARKSAKAA